MTNMVQKIMNEVKVGKDLTNPTDVGCAMDELADRLIEEVLDILNNRQGSMNQRADHARRLAEEIKWQLSTDFPHLG